MFFIKIGRKILKGIGLAVSILLILLCIMFIIISAVFKPEETVNFFGFNIFICGSGEFDGVNEGSAVIVYKCQPYDIENGDLILFSSAGVEEETAPELGYVGNVTVSDGVYVIEVSGEDGMRVVSEGAFIGKASWSSPVLGAVIKFSKTPFGVCVTALLPCLALIIYEIVKGVVQKLPPPAVEPQIKNREPDIGENLPGIAVKKDGNAVYSGRASSSSKPRNAASGILFSFNNNKDQKNVSGNIKPSNKKSESSVFTASKTPASVAAKRYIDNAVNSEPAAGKTVGFSDKSASKTTSAPQIGKTSSSSSSSFDNGNNPLSSLRGITSRRSSQRRDEPSGGRKSAEILIGKQRSELIAEDDDRLDKRYEVDDILSGIERRNKS